MGEAGKKLSEWLELMLGEIARKRDEAASARMEMTRRETEQEPKRPPTER